MTQILSENLEKALFEEFKNTIPKTFKDLRNSHNPDWESLSVQTEIVMLLTVMVEKGLITPEEVEPRLESAYKDVVRSLLENHGEKE